MRPIAKELKTMAEAKDHHLLQSKHKAITALLPYAVWRERDGQPEMIDAILRVTRASRTPMRMWRHVGRFLGTLLTEASPRAIVLALPHVLRYGYISAEALIQFWKAAVFAVPYSEEIAQGVVDTLLQLASEIGLQCIPIDLWSWLTKRPSLSPICEGRYPGTRGSVVKAVRALKDIEILKSYLLVVWSEWNSIFSDGFDEMYTLIQEDFGGIEMRHHRTDLIQRLDHVLGQLGRGLEYIQQHKLWFNEHSLWQGKNQYRKLRETLLEMNRRTPFTDYAPLYTDSYPGCTQNPVRHSCAHSLPHVYSPTTRMFDVPLHTLFVPLPQYSHSIRSVSRHSSCLPSLLHERGSDGDLRKYYELHTIDTGDPMGSDEMQLISLRVLKYLDCANPFIQRTSKGPQSFQVNNKHLALLIHSDSHSAWARSCHLH